MPKCLNIPEVIRFGDDTFFVLKKSEELSTNTVRVVYKTLNAFMIRLPIKDFIEKHVGCAVSDVRYIEHHVDKPPFFYGEKDRVWAVWKMVRDNKTETYEGIEGTLTCILDKNKRTWK